MVPRFPEFKLLTLEDKEVLLNICRQFEPYSDFNFSSIWTWNIQENVEIALFDEGLVLKVPDYITGRPTYTLIADDKCYEKILLLLEFVSEQGLEATLRMVPSVVVENLSESQRKKLRIHEDIDNHDYVLNTHEIASFEGKKYYDKRNLVNRFRRLYPNHAVKLIDLGIIGTQKEIMTVFESWVSATGNSPEDVANERKAIQRMLIFAHKLDTKGIGIYVDDVLIAFATFEKDGDYGFISFEKAIREFDGIYAYLNHLTANELKKLDCTWINFEQDLGIPGLRKAKELWRPIKYLHKYSVSLR